jgi:hypothetical protein
MQVKTPNIEDKQSASPTGLEDQLSKVAVPAEQVENNPAPVAAHGANGFTEGDLELTKGSNQPLTNEGTNGETAT